MRHGILIDKYSGNFAYQARDGGGYFSSRCIIKSLYLAITSLALPPFWGPYYQY